MQSFVLVLFTAQFGDGWLNSVKQHAGNGVKDGFELETQQ